MERELGAYIICALKGQKYTKLDHENVSTVYSYMQFMTRLECETRLRDHLHDMIFEVAQICFILEEVRVEEDRSYYLSKASTFLMRSPVFLSSNEEEREAMVRAIVWY